MAKLTSASIALVSAIGVAMASDPGYAFATEKEAKQLVDGKLAEFNPAITDGDKIAIRLTDEGLKMTDTTNTGTTAPATTATSGFAITFSLRS